MSNVFTNFKSNTFDLLDIFAYSISF